MQCKAKWTQCILRDSEGLEGPRLRFWLCGISCDRGQTAGRSPGKIQQKSRNEEDKEQEENRFLVPGGV